MKIMNLISKNLKSENKNLSIKNIIKKKDKIIFKNIKNIKIFKEIPAFNFSIIKLTRLVILFLLTLIMFSGFLISCSKPLIISGSSFGYYIWEDKQNNIYIEWSANRNKNSFNGIIKTDGKFENVRKIDIESDDIITQNNNEIDFNASLSDKDYSDELVIKVSDYTYVEFDLKLNNKYDLSRINIGKYLNNPTSNVFKIDKNYFQNLKKISWYKNHPFNEFFHKLYVNKYLTFLYLFILGAIIIGILRITKFESKKKKNLLVFISYILLILIDIGIIIFLWFVNGH
jgi:hypothetical protein